MISQSEAMSTTVTINLSFDQGQANYQCDFLQSVHSFVSERKSIFSTKDVVGNATVVCAEWFAFYYPTHLHLLSYEP